MTTAAVVFVAVTLAVTTFVFSAAWYHGRQATKIHRASRNVMIVSAVLVIPGAFVGATSWLDLWTVEWRGDIVIFAMGLGLILFIAAATLLLVADSMFVWKHRRAIFRLTKREDSAKEKS